MKVQQLLILTRPARKSGGDRYEAQLGGDTMVIYVPQVISRPEGQPLEKIKVTFED